MSGKTSSDSDLLLQYWIEDDEQDVRDRNTYEQYAKSTENQGFTPLPFYDWLHSE